MIPLLVQGVGWDAELGRGLRQLMWGTGMPWDGQHLGAPWTLYQVSILAPQELFPTLHFCTEIVTQILLEPLSILPWPRGYPGMTRPIAATSVQAVLV